MRRLLIGLAVVLTCPASAAAAPATKARIVTWTLRSAYVDPAGPTPFNRPPGTAPRPNALRVNILLPAGYDGRRRFPVLWLLHGHGDAYDSWLNSEQGDLLHVAGDFPGLIVMPDGAQGWYTDWLSGGTHRPGWESYFLGELMPLVERRLRILPGRQNHAIAGLSMGGEGAVYLAEQRPGYFGAVASFSGTLSIQRPEWPSGFGTQGQDYTTVYGASDGFYATGHNPTALAANLAHTRVFVSVGDGVPDPTYSGELTNTFGSVAERDLRFHAEDFLAAARQAGADPTYTPHQGIHAWHYWRQDLAAALRWGFFGPVANAATAWSFTTVRQHSTAWDLRLDFRALPATVERFTRSGDVLSGAGAGTVTVTSAAGRRFTATLPFRHLLASDARRSSPRKVRPQPRRRARRHVWRR